MTSIYETYAAKICRHVELPPGTYDSQKLNSYIMALPLGEAHAALDKVELEHLPRLGDTLSLNDHMQVHFFSLLLNPARDLWEFTKPVLIKHQHLERLEAYVSKLLETGRFPSRSAVLREAVRMRSGAISVRPMPRLLRGWVKSMIPALTCSRMS